MRNVILILATIIATISLSGCATKSSLKANPLNVEGYDQNCLEGYRIVTFEPFEVAPKNNKKIDPSVGVKFSKMVQERLKYDFEGVFDEVHFSDSNIDQATPNHLIIKGTIEKYEPGSRFWRGMLIGLGAANFDGRIIISDANSDEALLKAPISKFWAWGGLLGMSKDMDDMIEEAAASTAKTIALKAGWVDTSVAPKQVAGSH